MPNVEIRNATPDDVASLADVYRRASLSNDGDRPMLLAHPETLVLDASSVLAGWTRVGVVAGRVVGFATTRPTGEVAELDDLFVDPDLMRRGVARALIADALEVARLHGWRRIEVTGNGHALEFYEAVGFVRQGMTATPFGEGFRMHLDVPG